MDSSRPDIFGFGRAPGAAAAGGGASQRFLAEGACVCEFADGGRAWLPNGVRLLANVEAVFLRAMRVAGAREIKLPLLFPGSAADPHWGAADQRRIFELRDCRGEALVVAPQTEPAVAELAAGLDLSAGALRLFHRGARIVGAPVGGGGRGDRESPLLECHGLYASPSALNNDIPRLFKAAWSVLGECGLEALVADGLPAYEGGLPRYDFVAAERGGDYGLVHCPRCGYSADRRTAIGAWSVRRERLLPLIENIRSSVPNSRGLVSSLGIPAERLCVCRLWRCDGGLALSVARGDQEVSPHKLGACLGKKVLGPLEEAECARLGLMPDFLSPLHRDPSWWGDKGILVAVDRVAAETPNMLMGANAAGSYAVNANFGRDFDGHAVGDLSLVSAANRCYHCGGSLQLRQAVRLASIARHDDHFCALRRARSGTSKGGRAFYQSSLTFDVERVAAAVARSWRDRRGLRWPVNLAPIKAALLVVGRSPALAAQAESIHARLRELALWDDRDLPITRKIRDLDRLGIPLRIVLTRRGLEMGEAVLINRHGPAAERVPIGELWGRLNEHCQKTPEDAGYGNEI